MRHAIAAAALLLAACSGPLLTAEIEVPHIAVTVPSQSFDASDTSNPADWCDPSGLGDPPCIARTIDYDLGAHVPALTNNNVSYDLRLTDAAIILSAGESGDLSGVESAKVIVGADPAVPGSGTVVASYTKPSADVHPTSISVSGNAGVDLGPYLDAGNLPVRVEVVLTSGTPAFLADVQAGFSIVITVDWGSYL